MSINYNSADTANTINRAIDNSMGLTTTDQGASSAGLIIKEDLQPVVQCTSGFDYAVTVKEISGVPPLSFHSMGQVLQWSIDGNTDSGNSVGDKTENMFNISTWENVTATRGNVTIENDTITITATENDCYTNTYGNATYDIDVIAGETYTLIWDVDYLSAGILYFFTGSTVANNVLLSVLSSLKEKSFTVPEGHTKFAFRLSVATSGREVTYNKIMLYHGEEEKAYEPYGYDIPIVVNTTDTYHCYITDVLRKSDGETPVYDTMDSTGTIYRRVDTDGTPLETPTEEYFTAPDVVVEWGNNTVDVDTTVTPSNMTITYKDN